jgi:hypothetical protein
MRSITSTPPSPWLALDLDRIGFQTSELRNPWPGPDRARRRIRTMRSEFGSSNRKEVIGLSGRSRIKEQRLTSNILPACDSWARRPRYSNCTLRDQRESYLAQTDCSDSGSTVPGHIRTAFHEYLRCRILVHGFARAYCQGCVYGFPIASNLMGATSSRRSRCVVYSRRSLTWSTRCCRGWDPSFGYLRRPSGCPGSCGVFDDQDLSQFCTPNPADHDQLLGHRKPLYSSQHSAAEWPQRFRPPSHTVIIESAEMPPTTKEATRA